MAACVFGCTWLSSTSSRWISDHSKSSLAYLRACNNVIVVVHSVINIWDGICNCPGTKSLAVGISTIPPTPCSARSCFRLFSVAVKGRGQAQDKYGSLIARPLLSPIARTLFVGRRRFTNVFGCNIRFIILNCFFSVRLKGYTCFKKIINMETPPVLVTHLINFYSINGKFLQYYSYSNTNLYSNIS